MPKGTKFVDWTNPQNDAKLLVSVLKHVDVAKHYAEIAQDFGTFQVLLVKIIWLRVIF